ncbi:hypothetical protein [Ruixingdingia sedimenti]|uniref:Uncharacterized protein n=1 Tax=Ruixingdingia sedimenti TaxID=3073604 RepID=A0ABU1FGN7_9RHOB|nr:hypothetical protein [Xinfangfangia sp. LG-4]MDR5655562.1 hypothetical protein [Xinfangfangia sp. LG-4]
MTPAMDLDTARAMIMRPDLHSLNGLRGACTAAELAGDWIDAERARQLRARLDAEEAERGDRITITMAEAAGVIGLFGALVLGLWIAAGLGLPTGAEQLLSPP